MERCLYTLPFSIFRWRLWGWKGGMGKEVEEETKEEKNEKTENEDGMNETKEGEM